MKSGKVLAQVSKAALHPAMCLGRGSSSKGHSHLRKYITLHLAGNTTNLSIKPVQLRGVRSYVDRNPDDRVGEQAAADRKQ